MALQKTINIQQGFGLIGDVFTDSPYRITAMVAEDAVTIANPVEITIDGKAKSSLNKVDGVATHSKQHTMRGDISAPTMTLTKGEVVEVLTMGDVVLAVTEAVNVGDALGWNKSTNKWVKFKSDGNIVATGAIIMKQVTGETGGLTVARFTK